MLTPRPGQATEQLFLKLSKLAQGPSKTLDNQFPRYIFVENNTCSVSILSILTDECSTQ
jgi:hypothetical protein